MSKCLICEPSDNVYSIITKNTIKNESLEFLGGDSIESSLKVCKEKKPDIVIYNVGCTLFLNSDFLSEDHTTFFLNELNSYGNKTIVILYTNGTYFSIPSSKEYSNLSIINYSHNDQYVLIDFEKFDFADKLNFFLNNYSSLVRFEININNLMEYCCKFLRTETSELYDIYKLKSQHSIDAKTGFEGILPIYIIISENSSAEYYTGKFEDLIDDYKFKPLTFETN